MSAMRHCLFYIASRRPRSRLATAEPSHRILVLYAAVIRRTIGPTFPPRDDEAGQVGNAGEGPVNPSLERGEVEPIRSVEWAMGTPGVAPPTLTLPVRRLRNADLTGRPPWHGGPPRCLGNRPAEGDWATDD
jgi:hypothetical protein